MTLTHILVDFENTQPSAADVSLLRAPSQAPAAQRGREAEERRLWIFRGPGQKKYDAEFAEALQALGDRVRFVKCEKSGRNALDMHIAFQIGRLLGELTEAQKATAFVVVSRDTDYEPLLQYVRAQGYAATRVTSVREALGAAPAPKAAVAKAARTKAVPAPAPKARPAAAKPKAAKKAPAAKAARTATKVVSAKGTARAATRPVQAPAAQPIDELVDKVFDRLRDYPKNRPTRRDRMESWLASHLRSKLAGGEIPAIVAALEKRGVVRFEGNKIEYPMWS